MPTYYNEGVPRILLEAAALGKSIISTNQADAQIFVLIIIMDLQ